MSLGCPYYTADRHVEIFQVLRGESMKIPTLAIIPTTKKRFDEV